MAVTRRAQILMEPEEYRRLQREARRRKISVAELIRSTLRETCLAENPDVSEIVERIAGMQLPAIDWKTAKQEIEASHGIH